LIISIGRKIWKQIHNPNLLYMFPKVSSISAFGRMARRALLAHFVYIIEG
jgi:hypothetical protein